MPTLRDISKILQRFDRELRKAVEQGAESRRTGSPSREATQAAGMRWKPLMSKAEAEEYTRDSYYQGQDFYHGTSTENANGIVTKGAKWPIDSENSYGDGFYLNPDKSRAADYAKVNKSPSIVTARILCKNPKIFENGTDFYEFLGSYEMPTSDSEAGFASRLLISQGYDSVEIRGTQTLVIILDPQQVAVFKNESGT